MHHLHTRNQQLYFFSFIVGIVAIMKYIDVEFMNQAVTIPFSDTHPQDRDMIEGLIHQQSECIIDHKTKPLKKAVLASNNEKMERTITMSDYNDSEIFDSQLSQPQEQEVYLQDLQLISYYLYMISTSNILCNYPEIMLNIILLVTRPNSYD